MPAQHACHVSCLQHLLATADPDAGPLLYFFLYSWLYAFYWHDYKWSLTNSPVRSRLDLFESHWAFFAGGPAAHAVFCLVQICMLGQLGFNGVAGFGSICIIPQWFFSFLHSEAIMGMLFPLFVLVACDTDPRRQSKAGMGGDCSVLSYHDTKFGMTHACNACSCQPGSRAWRGLDTATAANIQSGRRGLQHAHNEASCHCGISAKPGSHS